MAGYSTSPVAATQTAGAGVAAVHRDSCRDDRCVVRRRSSRFRMAPPTRSTARWGSYFIAPVLVTRSVESGRPIVQQTAAMMEEPAPPLLLASAPVETNEPAAAQQETPAQPPKSTSGASASARENSTEANQVKRQSQRSAHRQAFTAHPARAAMARPASSAFRAKAASSFTFSTARPAWKAARSPLRRSNF